jgi:chaperonin GroEL
MAKQILFDQEVQEKIIKGVNKLTNTVKTTLGPKGKNVMLDKGFGAPTTTKDGVTVAKEIELEDKFENMGAEIVKEVASKTNDKAGDGTTTAAVLTQFMVLNGFELLRQRSASGAGMNTQDLQVGMQRATEKVIKYLDENARKLEGDIEMIRQVATMSANNDEEIGKIVAEVIKEVGKDGVVTVEEGQSFGIKKEHKKGMQFDKGYVSAYMITNPERMEAVYENIKILITDQKVSALADILPLLEKLAQSGNKELVIIADEIEGEALATFVVNKLRGTFNVLAVKAPGFGDRKKEMLEDIAVLTGGKVISEEVGLKLEKAEIEMLGEAKKVIATKENTTIVEGKGDQKAIKDRIAQIKAELKDSTSDFDKEKLQERLAKLSGGVAVIIVGAATEVEMKEKKHRIEDAVAATKAAIEEGIVAGGGTALLAAKFKKFIGHEQMLATSPTVAESVHLGEIIVANALESPLFQIAENGGKNGRDIIINVVRMMKDEEAGIIVQVTDPKQIINETAGYDAKNDRLVPDMFQAGIVDPVKVTKTALQNAVSAASMILTTSAAVAEKPEEKEKGGMPAGMPGGMEY